MRKVAMVAQYFPPAGGVGTFRVTKFVKYLRRFGWEPVVVSVTPEWYKRDLFPLDASLSDDIPDGLRQYRTPMSGKWGVRDAGIRWLPFLLPVLYRVIRNEKPDLLYLTGDPFVPLIAGPIMFKMFGLPYVIDLRDPWALAERDNARLSMKVRVARSVVDRAEPFVLRHAAKIVCVSEHMCSAYRRAYSTRIGDKFLVITNGFDPCDYEAIEPKKLDQFSIVYTGKFRTGEMFRDPEVVFQTIAFLKEKGEAVHFVHVGQPEEKVRNIARKYNVEESFQPVGWCSYKESISYAKGAHVLLVIGGGQLSEQTGKIFDYIACKRPILAIANPDGEIAKVVSAIPHARLLDRPTPRQLAVALASFRGMTIPNEYEDGAVRRFERHNLTERLADLFDSVAHQGRCAGLSSHPSEPDPSSSLR